ncbi:MAG: DUF2213 domain-containing protein [Eubacteriales bacterium]|nr:DUF2213 domain-containing protein [Eubacteriales bacterium]
MHYYGTRLSENISRREPEGYLLCLNVPVARTGTQEYLPEELGMPSIGPPDMISVVRPESEVFSPETIASFEGMPVTNDHPPDGVDIGNIRALQKGHAHNVRRGTGEESDLLLADLIITDPVLIDLILDGKREISCGYTYELHEENGTYIQRKIRGNHVAVVDAGRAGPRVCIKDHKVNKPERSTHIMKKSLSRILARMAKDGDIETVAEIIEEMIEPEAAETPVEAIAETVAEIAPAAAAPVVEAVAAAAEPEAVIETPEATIVVDEATLADIVSRLDRLIELLTPAPAADDDPADPVADPVEEIAEAVEEAIEAAAAAEEEAILPDEDLPESLGIDPEEVAEIVGEILDPVAAEAVSEVLDPTDPLVDECDPEENREALSAGDALRTALRAVRPALVKMPKKQRARVCADIAARLHRPAARRGADAGAGTGAYNALAALKRKPARGNPADLGKRIMASRNVNCHKK